MVLVDSDQKVRLYIAHEVDAENHIRAELPLDTDIHLE